MTEDAVGSRVREWFERAPGSNASGDNNAKETQKMCYKHQVWEAPSEAQSLLDSDSWVRQPPEAPPVPAEGLPEGWTMDQWKWYGAEWLAKQGK